LPLVLSKAMARRSAADVPALDLSLHSPGRVEGVGLAGLGLAGARRVAEVHVDYRIYGSGLPHSCGSGGGFAYDEFARPFLVMGSFPDILNAPA
jgi:hypothetical protein